jgi:3-oxoacyl-[acyl-carrier-protein] synthase-3
MSLPDVFVHDFAFALGDESADVVEAEARGRIRTAASALRAVGFRSHHVCRDDTTAYDLARRAVEPIRERLGDVGALIYSTCLPCNGNIGDEAEFRRTRDVKHVMDFPASHLQADFGLEKASVIGLNQQACTSMLGALRLAGALLRSEPDLVRVLCVTADRFPVNALYEQAYNLISDGAAACIVSREPRGYRILACHQITNGALAQASDEETVGSYFSYTHRVVREVLARAGVGMDEIAWIVPQNTNITAWKVLSRILGFDVERVFFETIGDIGHIISSDNVVNLLALEKARAVPPGAKLLLVMAGFGLNWQAVVLEKV